MDVCLFLLSISIGIIRIICLKSDNFYFRADCHLYDNNFPMTGYDETEYNVLISCMNQIWKFVQMFGPGNFLLLAANFTMNSYLNGLL